MASPLQYSCLENPTDREAWRATVHRVAKTRLSDWHFHFHLGWGLIQPASWPSVLKWKLLSCLWLFATLWTVARLCRAPLFMEFSRQEYWSGLPFWDLPNPGVKPGSPTLQADSLPSEPPGKTFWSLLFFPYKIYPLLEISTFLKKKVYLFIYFWLHWVFLAASKLSLVVTSEGCSLVRECRVLTVVASLVAEHRF